jgi:hypothetical protein
VLTVAENSRTAEVRPLQGKHYGTTVAFHYANRTFAINVWIPVGPPSDEACADWGITKEQWEANVEVDDGWGGTMPIQSEFPCDSHYQSEIEKLVAGHIDYALNVLPIPDLKEARREG